MLARIIHAAERKHARRDSNRKVLPFAWGQEYLPSFDGPADPRQFFAAHSRKVLAASEEFYALPPVTSFELQAAELTWISSVQTAYSENNLVRAQYFPATGAGKDSGRARRAVLILPHWNASPDSYISLCRLLNRMGIAALRLTLPYHELRRPAETARADYLVSSNVGQSLQSMRQAVLDTRAAVEWLKTEMGFERVGMLGTSIGSCIGFLAFAHDNHIDAGIFNHVSGYVADVVWRGISTEHVRAGFAEHVTLDELREYWLPISPMSFIKRVVGDKRPMHFLAAKYDLTFPVDLSRDVVRTVRELGIEVDVTWLPCGHYTSGDKPWIYLEAWKIVNFFRRKL